MWPFIGLLLLVLSPVAVALTENGAYYNFDCASKDGQIHAIGARDYLMYMADELDISDFYALGGLDEPHLQSIGRVHEASVCSKVEKPKMIITVSGVTEPGTFVQRLPHFEIKASERDSKLSDIFDVFPRQLKAKDNCKMSVLSPEVTLLSHSSNEKLENTFGDLNSASKDFWNSFKLGDSHKSYQKILKTSVDTRSLRHVNDKIFMYELKQLLHLALHPLLSRDGIIFMNFNALSSIGEKVGYSSRTYKLAKALLADAFINLSRNYGVSLIVQPFSDYSKSSFVQKRDKELQAVFTKDETKDKNCFSSEENCEKLTSACQSHGKCIKSGSCWSCKCSSTSNSDSGKTTYWAGNDCSKKDISFEANLFLWSGIALSICIVYAIKLLVSVGSEELPGVLGAVSGKN